MLRLVARPDGGLVYGELVDVDTGSSSPFVDWTSQTRVVREWLEEAVQRGAGSAKDTAGTYERGQQ
jgi:hypothetical protein